ncbi:glycosyltransferase family 2 protein [Litoreibacter roseus]|uniref:Glycosyltransferase 2-like domain-containing protein n=1 Tax=Litoreibacter roseus TaxID=2601869 RepID=A0A6N6JE03_9RHOB|nr:glycosyltransferase [Litoreibacter roseus]GFE64573.1 hypothetical protein KIN_16470 [Litoreibacter roseus]
MTETAASVIIASRHRPRDLLKCLKALEFQHHRNFEVVVVSDPSGCAAIKDSTFSGRVKLIPFDEPNISRARNTGLERAAADIVAFIDDDAIAEPTWLIRLIAPFEDQTVLGTTGYARGRNGISYRWTGEYIQPNGDVVPRNPAAPERYVHGADPVLMAIGMNCAFRASALSKVGGYDPNFHYGLDDADLSMRLAELEGATILVPLAQVQHISGPNETRSTAQVPTSMIEHGASFGWWSKKYDRSLDEFYAIAKKLWRDSIDPRLVRGDLEPKSARQLAEGFAEGFKIGQSRTRIEHRLEPAQAPFLRYSEKLKPNNLKVVPGYVWNRQDLYQRARDLARQNTVVTVMSMSPTSLFHRRFFHEDGFWVQSGGIYGKSDRKDPLFKWQTLAERVQREAVALSVTRP